MEEENTIVEEEELVSNETISNDNLEEINTPAEEPAPTPEVEKEESLKVMPETEPTPEQLAFKEVVAEMEKLNLNTGDTVCFRNGEIGRIDAFDINETDLMYRIYVKITDDVIITLNEELKNTDGNANYDVTKILSQDFTSIKTEIELSNLVLTKEQAQEELTTLKGQTVVIE